MCVVLGGAWCGVVLGGVVFFFLVRVFVFVSGRGVCVFVWGVVVVVVVCVFWGVVWRGV